MTLRRILPALMLLFAAWPAGAAVTISFYSHELGSSYPHAFILLEGTPDGGGEPISGNYGFTAKHVTPAILMGSVTGDIESAGPAYVRHSRAHWRMVLSDGQYAAIRAAMHRWATLPGKSYNLNSRNCVHFVADMARTLGMDVPEPKALMRKPRSFLASVLARNAALQEPPPGGVETATSGVAKSGQASEDPAVPVLRATAEPAIDPALPLAPLPVAAVMSEESRNMKRGGGASAAPSPQP
jgi:hypothetical protein